jgi:hypothetical protein
MTNVLHTGKMYYNEEKRGGIHLKRTVGIAGQESEYWVKLMEYLNRQGRFETFVCTREECLEEEIQKRKPVVLFREQGFASEVSFDGTEVFFVSSRTAGSGIYPYQPAERIYEEMLGYLPKEQLFVPTGDAKEKKVCCVYSPLGRSGKTSFALSYAKRHSFFYIGLEDYGITGESIHGMSEILYYIHNRKEGITETVLEMSESWKEIRMLRSPFLFQDIRQISVEDYAWFFENLRKDPVFPSVIVDLGTGCLPDFEMFDFFDQIYVPILDGSVETAKLRKFWNLLQEIDGSVSDRFRILRVPRKNWEEEGFLDQVKETSYREAYSLQYQ